MFDKLKIPLDKETRRTMYQRLSGWDRDDEIIHKNICVHTYVPPVIYVYSLLFYYHPSPMQFIEERAYLVYGFRGLEYKMA